MTSSDHPINVSSAKTKGSDPIIADMLGNDFDKPTYPNIHSMQRLKSDKQEPNPALLLN